MTRTASTFAFVFSGFFISSCAGTHKNEDAAAAAVSAPTIENAVVILTPAKGEKVNGTINFTQEANGVKVTGEFEGLKPRGRHGIHIHEMGDCSDPKFESAGGHFNPTGAAHGGPDSAEKHVGDFGNLKADGRGRAKLELTLEGLTLGDPAMGLVGRSVVVHQKPDDLKSQPSGNSGDRIACGRIEAAQL